MKFSVVLPEQHPHDADPSAAFERLLNHAKEAEKRHYHSVWIGEHQAATDIFFHPVTALAALARETSRVKLGLSMIAPLHHPIDLAYSLANIDVISGGRLIFSPVLGYRTEEFEALQIPFHERRSRMEETISIILKLWTKEVVTHRGRHFQFKGVSVNPRPLQKPHPPIWVGGTSSGSIRRAVEFGDGWMPMSILAIDELRGMYETYRSLLKKSGVGHDKVETPIFVEAYLGRNNEEARRAVGKQLLEKYNTYVKWGFPISSPKDGFTLDDLSDRILVGDLDSCIKKVERLQSIGVNHLILRFGFKGMSHDVVLRTLRLWADKVIPYFEKV